MLTVGASLTFSSLPADWLLITAAATVVAWEWLRAAWLCRPGRAGVRRFALVLVAGPAAGVLLTMLLRHEPRWAMLILAGAAVAWAGRSYRATTAPLSVRARRALRVLRGAVLLLLVLLATGPVWTDRLTEPVREGLALLIDTSRSMNQADMPLPTGDDEDAPVGALTRIAAVDSALYTHQSPRRRLEERYDLRVAGFDARLHYGAAEGLSATGDRTAIGDAIQRAKDDFLADGVPLAGVCVVTDGCNNAADIVNPLAQAEAMAARGTALWLVGVGSDRAGAWASLNVRDLQAPTKVDLMQEMTVWADVEGVGLEGQTVLVQARLGGQSLGARQVQFDQPVQTRRVHFRGAPTEAGFQRLTVSAERPAIGERPLVGELGQARMVHVTRRTLRVLYIEGRRRHEGKFIAAALAGQERFDLTRWIIGEPLGEEGDPSSARAFWQGYHVVVLGDLRAGTLGWARLEQLRRLVAEDGRAVVMIGGRDSFAGGGWADSRLAPALPVQMGPAGQTLAGPVRVVPTPEGLAEGPLRIGGDQDDQSAWQRLRPLAGAEVMGQPKPAATVLARTSEGDPLIVAQQYGAGRTLAVAFDTTWQWVLAPQDTGELQKRFWRQVLLWAGNPSADAWVTTDSPRYDSRQLAAGQARITVQAGVEDADGTPRPDVPVVVKLSGPGAEPAPVNLQAQGPIRQAVLGVLPAGQYKLELTGTMGERTLSAEHVFEVIDRDLEAADVVANLPLLRQMGQLAEPAGGGYRPLSELGDVLERFAVHRPPAFRQRTISDDLVERFRWQLLVALLTTLCVEWAARKWLGLV